MLYIIGGPAKSGKTTLRKTLLQEQGISGISTDYLRAMFQENTELNITSQNSPEINYKNIEVFLDGFIKEFLYFSDEDFILEGDLLIEDLYEKYSNFSDKVFFVYMGYPDISLKNKVKQTREKEKVIKSWVNDVDKESLQKILSYGISKSKKLKSFCKQNNIYFINTSRNFDFHLKKFIEEI